jgi:hypothetical protein
VYRELSERLNGLRDAYETAFGSDLKRLNVAFAAQGLQPIAIPSAKP